jgi:hypothetical protein
VSEIVFEVACVGLPDVEGLVLDLPAGAAAGGDFGDVVPVDRQIGDEAVVIGALSGGVADLDFEPVDQQRPCCRVTAAGSSSGKRGAVGGAGCARSARAGRAPPR